MSYTIQVIQKSTTTSMLINILQFPKKKGNNLNPWYVILYRLCLYPFVLVFGIGFYISVLALTLSPYSAEQFRKDYL